MNQTIVFWVGDSLSDQTDKSRYVPKALLSDSANYKKVNKLYSRFNEKSKNVLVVNDEWVAFARELGAEINQN